jgi:hypothetical protein
MDVLAKLDWWVYEDPESAFVDERLITDKELNTVVSDGYMLIILPCSQYESITSSVRVDAPATVLKILSRIRDFYLFITPPWAYHKSRFYDESEWECGYKRNALNSKNMGKMNNLDLIGERTPERPDGKRRHPLSNLGMVRFENLEHLHDNSWNLLLGN